MIAANSPLLGHSLAQANVRRRTGATVMAFERGKKLHRYPTGDYIFEANDRLLVIGNSDEHTTFKSLLLGLRSPDSA
jgi:CPA2 family monovalent cation:H+ antiporter-2